MAVIAEQYARSGVRLTEFEKRIAEYRQRRHEMESDPHALADYDRAIELDPAKTSAIVNRGQVHVAMGRYDEALADYNRAVELDSGNAWALSNRGRVYRAMESPVTEPADSTIEPTALKTTHRVPLTSADTARTQGLRPHLAQGRVTATQTYLLADALPLNLALAALGPCAPRQNTWRARGKPMSFVRQPDDQVRQVGRAEEHEKHGQEAHRRAPSADGVPDRGPLVVTSPGQVVINLFEIVGVS
jgi:tetratricopeptide (TPR) repeat protein